MRRTSLLTGAIALAMMLGTAPGAHAAGAVFGGSTTGGEAVVLNADKSVNKLRSAVVAWSAKCADGGFLPFSTTVTATTPSPGFSPGPRALTMTRNRRGRFAGTQRLALSLGDASAAVEVTFAGRFGAKAASGTLSAQATVIANATGNTQTTCRTGRLQWKASRAPGRVYGGSTSQEEPFVAKLDAKGKRVTDVLLSWNTKSCQPEAGFYYPEHLSNFSVASGGRFGDTWNDTVRDPDGGTRRFDLELKGKVSRKVVRGTFHAAIAGVDGAGAPNLTCDTGGVTWKATTG